MLTYNPPATQTNSWCIATTQVSTTPAGKLPEGTEGSEPHTLVVKVVGARAGGPGALEAQGEEVGWAADDLAPQQEGLVGQEVGLQPSRALHRQRLPFCQADVLYLQGTQVSPPQHCLARSWSLSGFSAVDSPLELVCAGQRLSNMVSSAINHPPRREQQGPASALPEHHSTARPTPAALQTASLALWSNLLLMMLIKPCCMVRSSSSGECGLEQG